MGEMGRKTTRAAPLAALLVMVWVGVCLGSKVRHYKWNVEYMFLSPDCVENMVMGINGQFPGPTIRAAVGDTVSVELTNKLPTEGVVIHWHGIRQFGTPWADGTASISQCPINPGETFTYRFKVDKEGTYFYHGHYGMQRSAGLYGSLIVEVGEGVVEPFKYDGEFSLLLSDWWHQSAEEQELGLSSKPMRWIGEPQSLLINGRGQFNCSLGAHYSNSSSMKQCNLRGGEQCAPQILSVDPGKTYRIRLASTTALSSLSFQIGEHKMLVVEADGNYVQPFMVNDLNIYSGETYSVLLTADQHPNANYWVSLSVTARQPKTPQALTILNYKPTSASTYPSLPPPAALLWNDYNHGKYLANRVRARMGSQSPPLTCDRRIVLLNTQNKIDGFIRWALNNVSLALPATPYLGSFKLGLKNAFNLKSPPVNLPGGYDVMKPPVNPNATSGDGVYVLRFNSTVDIVLQNANALAANVSEVHPWHLHGHDFWILGYGEGKFVAERDGQRLNLKDPPFRNTAVLFPYGWTVLRFTATNPGVWAFHCHIEPHLHMGMGVVIAEGVRRLGRIPSEALACGLTAKRLMNNHHK